MGVRTLNSICSTPQLRDEMARCRALQDRPGGDDRRASVDAHLKALLDPLRHTDNDRTRLTHIMDWLSRMAWRGEPHLQRHRTLLDRTPVVTHKETREVQANCTSAKDVRDWLERFRVVHPSDPAEIMRGLFEQTLSLYAQDVIEASESPRDEGMVQGISRAQRDVALLSILAFELGGAGTDAPFLGPRHFGATFSAFSDWAHFTSPSQYVPLRQKEQQLLEALVRAKGMDPFEILRILIDASNHEDLHPERSALSRALRQPAEQRAADCLCLLLQVENGFDSITGAASRAAERSILFRAGSPLWRKPTRSVLKKILATNQRHVSENAVEFIMAVGGRREAGLRRGDVSSDEIEALLKDREAIEWFWLAATSHAPNMRRFQGIREARAVVEQQCGALPTPLWWPRIEEEWNKAARPTTKET